MPKRKRRKAPGVTKRIDYAALNAREEYEELCQRANSDRIRKALAGRMAPTRRAVVDKLNRRRKEREEMTWKQ